jgi:hypothetical protein
VVFGPERDVPLSKSGLRWAAAKDIAFSSDPVLPRWSEAPSDYNIAIAGYPQAEVVDKGLISLPTLMIDGPASVYYLRVCLIFTTAAANFFRPHPVMLSVPLVRHRGANALYGPLTETLTVSDLRDGGRVLGEDGKASRKRGGHHEIISIWAAEDPATFAVQVCAGEPDGSSEWAHPAVLMTIVFRHKRTANAINERKKAKKVVKEANALDVCKQLEEEFDEKKITKSVSSE